MQHTTAGCLRTELCSLIFLNSPLKWRILRLWMEETPSTYGGQLRILNKQSRTADKEWSSSLGVGRQANNSL
jgi:hypothetical protein